MHTRATTLKVTQSSSERVISRAQVSSSVWKYDEFQLVWDGHLYLGIFIKYSALSLSRAIFKALLAAFEQGELAYKANFTND